MPLSPGFVEYVQELLAGFGKVEIRRMFGGAAVYRGGVGFAILDDDVMFIKADAALGAELKKQGCKPWLYSLKKDGSVRDIAYWSVPASAADDPDEAAALARRSFEIAKRAAVDKKKTIKRPQKATQGPKVTKKPSPRRR